MNIDVTYIVIVLVVTLLSMTIHEAMHAFAGYWLGDDTARLEGRLTLNPIKHIDPFMTILLPVLLAATGGPIFGGAKPVPFNPSNIKWAEWGAAIVAIIGPLTNFLLAFLGFFVWVLIGHPNGGIQEILTAVVTVNLGFFLFNIIPIPPLDGSRVLYALAPDFVRRGMESMERFGLIVVFLLVVVFQSVLTMYLSGGLQYFVTLFSKLFGLV